jgi:cell division protein FtsB
MKRLVVPLLLMAALYYAVFGGGYSLLDLTRIHAEAERAELRLAELRAETEALERRADALENDPRTLERLARERFGMIYEGERLYRFAEPPERTDPEVDSEGVRE